MTRKPKQHEIVAVVKGRKASTQKAVTELYQHLQKPQLFDGMVRTYNAFDDNDKDKPPQEEKRPQQSVVTMLAEAQQKWAELFDLVLTMDVGNQVAKGDVVVDGVTLIAGVPVPTLLFLEKELEHLKVLVEAIPVPDSAMVWSFDENMNVLATAPITSISKRKVNKALVKYPATDKHPAQTEMVMEDVAVGAWTGRQLTTRMPAARKAGLVARATKLLDAVKVAREQANTIEVDKQKMGESLLGYVFTDKA